MTLLRRAVRRTPWIAGTVIVAAGIGAGAAYAFWQSTDSSHVAGTSADSLPRGATPSGSLTGPGTVSVTFARASTSGGRDVTSYLVRRYASASASTPVASFGCTASGSTVTCTESSVPAGAWYYTDTPRFAGTQWTGDESPKSAPVSTDTTPPVVSVSSVSPAPNAKGLNNSSPVNVGLTATDSGSGVASITYWIGSGSHVTVSASTATAPVTGDGAHTVSFFATDAAGNDSTTKTQNVTIDTTRPVLSGLNVPAWINNAGKASVPVSGSITEANGSVVTVVATDKNNLTNTKTVTLTAGATSWSTNVDTSTFADGAVTIRATAVDDAGNSTSSALTGSSTRDIVAPLTPSSVTLANGSGDSDDYINSTNASSLSYTVGVSSNSANSTTDTITVTLTSGSTASATKTPSNPGGNVSVTGINATGINDGTVSVAAKATDLAGNSSGNRTTTTPKDTIATGTLSQLASRYTYDDRNSPLSDRISGSTGAITSFGGDTALTPFITELQGPHPGNTYLGPRRTTGQTSFNNAVVDSSGNNATVSYRIQLMDDAGNLTSSSFTLTVTGTD